MRFRKIRWVQGLCSSPSRDSPHVLNVLGATLRRTGYRFSVVKPCYSCDRNLDGTSPDDSLLKRGVRTSALNKSFSSAIAVRRDARPAEKSHHKLSRIEYTSIDQFQQRAELYRGRYAQAEFRIAILRHNSDMPISLPLLLHFYHMVLLHSLYLILGPSLHDDVGCCLAASRLYTRPSAQPHRRQSSSRRTTNPR